MDYFNDVFTTFLGFESDLLRLSIKRLKALRFHQKDHHLFSNFQRSLKGLERHEGK